MTEPTSLVSVNNKKRNEHFLSQLYRLIEEFENGEVVSAVISYRNAKGENTISRSYSETPSADAGDLMAMAMHRLGFSTEG